MAALEVDDDLSSSPSRASIIDDIVSLYLSNQIDGDAVDGRRGLLLWNATKESQEDSDDSDQSINVDDTSSGDEEGPDILRRSVGPKDLVANQQFHIQNLRDLSIGQDRRAQQFLAKKKSSSGKRKVSPRDK